MNRTKALCLTALMAWGLLAACTVADDDGIAMDYQTAYPQMVYDGEWTVNKQVVDTARLEVTGSLKVRLPEAYLTTLCFADKSTQTVAYKGQPAVIPFSSQGYTVNATFNELTSAENNYGGTMLFNSASFIVAVNGVEHRVDLLSNDPGNAVYRNDNEQWTIGFTVNSFNIVNMETREEQVRTLSQPIALYYNTKDRIR